MTFKRVVITGMSTITSLGSDWQTFKARANAGESGIKRMPEWDQFRDLNTRLGGPVTDFETPSHFTRKKTRGMGRISLMATASSEQALMQAGLLDDKDFLKSGQIGVAYGSSTGSTNAVKDFAGMLIEGDMTSVTATTYIRMMSHTSPVNIGVFFGLRGRLLTTSSACTSGSQAIGQAYETIKYGKQIAMVAGGGEELCPTEAAVFDTLYATSTANDTPHLTPRPFDKTRDGLVIGEGAGTLILEEREHALARGATIIAEVVGYGQNTDGGHITQPNRDTMRIAMELALQDAELNAGDIGYVNAHGTATDRGDIAESHATHNVFGPTMPVSTLKGHLGHTLGACGSVEAWAAINMMLDNQFLATLNLENPAPECAQLDYIISQPRKLSCEYIMSNNFAFGGINTSLVFKREA